MAGIDNHCEDAYPEYGTDTQVLCHVCILAHLASLEVHRDTGLGWDRSEVVLLRGNSGASGGRVSVNILGGLGGLIHWIFWLIHWEFVDNPWARVVLYENHVSARKIGSIRVVLYERRICNGNVTLSQKESLLVYSRAPCVS